VAFFRLAITLRYLASGNSFRDLMYSSRIHESTISLIIPEVCKAINSNMQEEYIKVKYMTLFYQI